MDSQRMAEILTVLLLEPSTRESFVVLGAIMVSLCTALVFCALLLSRK